MALDAIIHVQGTFQLLDHTLVEDNLLLEVSLHHILEVHLTPLVEVVHFSLQGEAHGPAALAHAVGLILVHLALVAHSLALFHLGKGTWRDRDRDREITSVTMWF